MNSKMNFCVQNLVIQSRFNIENLNFGWFFFFFLFTHAVKGSMETSYLYTEWWCCGIKITAGLDCLLSFWHFFSPSPWIYKCKCDLIKDSECLYHVAAWSRERWRWRVDNSNQTTHTLPSLTCNATLNSSALIEKRATVLTHSIICIILKSWKCHCCFMIIVGKWLATAFIHSRKKYFSIFSLMLIRINKMNNKITFEDKQYV